MSKEKVAKSKSCKVWFDFVQFRQRENFEDSSFCIFASLPAPHFTAAAAAEEATSSNGSVEVSSQ